MRITKEKLVTIYCDEKLCHPYCLFLKNEVTTLGDDFGVCCLYDEVLETYGIDAYERSCHCIVDFGKGE